MKLTNLQIQFNRIDLHEHQIIYVNERGTECRETLYSGEEFAQHVIDCMEAVPELRKERDEVQGTIKGLKQLLELPESAGLTELFNAVEALELNKSERDTLRKAYNSNVKDWRELCGYFNLPVSELSAVMSAIDTMRKERDAAQRLDGLVITDMDGNTLDWELSEGVVEIPHSTQPQLSEIRYVLHGDIQPCSVLYRDDTTTLLRLDEGDIMCETDTIEWSDSVTYRCQELLRGAMSGSARAAVARHLAQLVRDERILLNDNGEDELGADEACVAAVVVPAPPPFPRGVADHNNPYVHTTTMFSEEAMRSHGWTNEALVSCGHGHYVPMQYPADTEH